MVSSQKLNIKLSIALLGTRGLPAAYGGFETFAHELATRLTERGHEVTVFQRHSWRLRLRARSEAVLDGILRRSTATVMHKYAETPLSSLSSFLDLAFGRKRFDVALLCNAANSPFAFLAGLRSVPVAINVDGVERKRSKWNGAGKLWYRLGEQTSVWFAAAIIADAQVIAEYYRENFKLEPTVITYGAHAMPIAAGPVLQRFNLSAARYILYVSRFEPENNALGVVQAYVQAKASGALDGISLVMVGDAPYADAYKGLVRAAADESVVFTGFQFGEAYRELRSNCLCYVQATEVGGTHPALVEAMAYGNPIIANEVPEHREVLGDTGIYYARNDFTALAIQLTKVANDRAMRENLSALAVQRARALFSWEAVTDKYEELLIKLCNR